MGLSFLTFPRRGSSSRWSKSDSSIAESTLCGHGFSKFNRTEICDGFVPPAGIEPATPPLGKERSNPLSYGGACMVSLCRREK